MGVAMRGGGGGVVEQDARAIALPTTNAAQIFRMPIPEPTDFANRSVPEASRAHKLAALTANIGLAHQGVGAAITGEVYRRMHQNPGRRRQK